MTQKCECHMATKRGRKPSAKAERLKHAREEAKELLKLAKERCLTRRKDAEDIVKATTLKLKEAKRDLTSAKSTCTLEMGAARAEGKAHIRNA